jgi:hypothetical protein
MREKPSLISSLLIASLSCSIEAAAQVQSVKQESARARMQQLLGLKPEKFIPKAEILRKSEEGDVVIEDLRFESKGCADSNGKSKPHTPVARRPTVLRFTSPPAITLLPKICSSAFASGL